MVNFKPGEYMRERFSSVNDTGGSEKNPSAPNRSQTYDLLVTSPDALPLTYMRFVGARAIKLSSCDKRPTYC